MQLTTTHYIVSLVILLTCLIGLSNQARGSRKEPIVLGEDSWTQVLQGEWMIDLYAPWCPACRSLDPEWKKFAEWSDDLNINVAKADVTANPGLSGRFFISGLPTIYHVKDGKFRLYNGPREHTALINFIEEQGWKSMEPVSRWWSPDTLQMSFLAYSFRISMTLRDVHNHLVEKVGLPYYLSYLIFALCTVTLGTVLGLVIVFIVDQFCPTRYVTEGQNLPSGTSSRRKKSDKPSDSDLDDTVEVDDTSKSSKKGPLRKRTTNN